MGYRRSTSVARCSVRSMAGLLGRQLRCTVHAVPVHGLSSVSRTHTKNKKRGVAVPPCNSSTKEAVTADSWGWPGPLHDFFNSERYFSNNWGKKRKKNVVCI